MPLEGDETLLKSITVEGEGHWDSKRLDKGQVTKKDQKINRGYSGIGTGAIETKNGKRGLFMTGRNL
jgi:hypothetical protein